VMPCCGAWYRECGKRFLHFMHLYICKMTTAAAFGW
jgi:hypothetical protein